MIAHLLIAIGVVFGVNLLPAFGPPTWAVLAYFRFRYGDVPGMIGRVGTHFGEHGINIVSAAVGHVDNESDGPLAVMVITTDSAVPQEVIDEIVSLDGFEAGRTMTL